MTWLITSIFKGKKEGGAWRKSESATEKIARSERKKVLDYDPENAKMIKVIKRDIMINVKGLWCLLSLLEDSGKAMTKYKTYFTCSSVISITQLEF